MSSLGSAWRKSSYPPLPCPLRSTTGRWWSSSPRSSSRRPMASEVRPVEFLEAALTVLREEGKPLHWTVIQDLSLRRGYLDPFSQRDIRKQLLSALAAAVKSGEG